MTSPSPLVASMERSETGVGLALKEGSKGRKGRRREGKRGLGIKKTEERGKGESTFW